MGKDSTEKYNKPSLGNILYYAQILPRVGVYNLCDIKVCTLYIHTSLVWIQEINVDTFSIIQKLIKQFLRID